VCCFCQHWKFGERDTKGVCGALSLLEVYIYIYIYIYVYLYTARERERWRGERCCALSVLEVYIHLCILTYIHSLTHTQMARRAVWCVVSAWKRESARETHAQNQQDFKPQTPGSPQPDPSQGMGRHSKRVTWAGSTRTREREPREVLVCSWKR
jgi:hypothetical protein